MEYALYPAFLLTIFRTFFNTFIYPSGDDPLNAILLIPIAIGMILNLPIRYIIGHIVMSLLIIETDVGQDELTGVVGKKQVASSRRLFETLYWAARSFLMQLLALLAPRHRAIIALGSILSSGLLAERHFFWTARTILSRSQSSHVSKSCRLNRWRSLAIPTLIYTCSETLMAHLPAIMEDFAGILNACHPLLLLPSDIILVSVGVSLLPPTYETIVSTTKRKHGIRLGRSFRRLMYREGQNRHGTGRLPCYLELHAKMCLCLLLVDAGVHCAIY
ncbi:uncharacterized protein BO97DRAFT_464601 [Aspergillus homomorphus CBS 101889]|uniref:Uncharacterized protein n=1 Tax=Aspergillus homomorphus (strain CBS 101889) TaxID=1450537 RepID=A0A395HH98_ASPHC|nr:hypothetical protein BO97DRAFT_464601 [Aspergillus homomorphus CBS 101889]RAL07130.1 hypothetical protein BO97DRAFT_464601 [Aspergillus homomorphus CBS 101889]